MVRNKIELKMQDLSIIDTLELFPLLTLTMYKLVRIDSFLL